MVMPGRRPTALLPVLIGLVALTVLSGCADDRATAPEGEPPVRAIPVVLAAVNLRLPLSEFIRTDQQLRRVDDARLALIERCMGRFGFPFSVRRPPGEYGPRSLTERRYGITDAGLAASAGYGLGPRDPALRPRPHRSELSPEAESVLLGNGESVVAGAAVPDKGCVGEANRALTTSAPDGADIQLGEELAAMTFARSKQDSRVKRVQGEWSRCMARDGMHYADPFVPPGDPRLRTPAAHAEAIKVALADIRCKQATNLVGTWFAVESAYQERLIQERSRDLALTRQVLQGMDRFASSVLARKGQP